MAAGQEQHSVEPYNFTIFHGDEDYLLFRKAAGVGTFAPDFTATLLENGASVQLSDYWRENFLLVEFGSIT